MSTSTDAFRKCADRELAKLRKAIQDREARPRLTDPQRANIEHARDFYGHARERAGMALAWLKADRPGNAAAAALRCGMAINAARWFADPAARTEAWRRTGTSAKARQERGQRYLAMIETFRREGTAAGLSDRQAASAAITRALALYCAEVGYEVDRDRFRQYLRRWKLAART